MVGHDGAVRAEVAALGAELAGLARRDRAAGGQPDGAGLLLAVLVGAVPAGPAGRRPGPPDRGPPLVRRELGRRGSRSTSSPRTPTWPGTRLVVLPTVYLLADADVAALRAYVAGGGTLLVGCWSGLVDERDQVPPGPYPGRLRDLLGVTVAEHLPLAGAAVVRLGTTPTTW